MNDEKALAMRDQTVMMIGTENALETVTDRLMSLHPAAKLVGVPGMRLVAQLAMLTGANPLPTSGEVYVWKGRGNEGLVVDLGIAYYRRMARRNDEVFWIEEARPMTQQEAEKHAVPEGALASICKGYCGSKLVKLVEMGAPWDVAEARATRTSAAIVDHKEMYRTKDTNWSKKGDPIDAPRGRTWQWVCDKRAEKGFYRMEALIDTSFVDRMAQANKLVAEFGGPAYVEQDPDRIAAGNAIAETLEEEYGDPNNPMPKATISNVRVERSVPNNWQEQEARGRPDPRTEELPSANAQPSTLPAVEQEAEEQLARTEARPQTKQEAQPADRNAALSAAASANNFGELAQQVVIARVGYDAVSHVIQACTSKTVGFNVAHGIEGPFNLDSIDKQDLVNWLVERKVEQPA